MRTVRFKQPSGSITIGGQRFDNSNITPERYDALVAINEGHKELFEVTDEEEPGAKKPTAKAAAGKATAEV